MRWKDEQDQEALHRLTSAHMRLVISIAARFKNFGLSMTDLIQEGHVGLLEAAARFEPEREVRFSTYATWWIRASIQDYILRNWSIVRGGTSSAQKALFFNLQAPEGPVVEGRRQHERPGSLRPDRLGAIGVSQNDVALMDSRLSGPGRLAQRTDRRFRRLKLRPTGFHSQYRSASRRDCRPRDRSRTPDRVACRSHACPQRAGTADHPRAPAR